jgi:hypothetical protein
MFFKVGFVVKKNMPQSWLMPNEELSDMVGMELTRKNDEVLKQTNVTLNQKKDSWCVP